VTRALCGRDAGIGAFVFVAHFRAPSKISRLCSVCRQTFQAGSRPTGLRWARHRQLSRELRWRDYLQALTQWLQLVRIGGHKSVTFIARSNTSDGGRQRP
jgi:hypothetical protein